MNHIEYQQWETNVYESLWWCMIYWFITFVYIYHNPEAMGLCEALLPQDIATLTTVAEQVAYWVPRPGEWMVTYPSSEVSVWSWRYRPWLGIENPVCFWNEETIFTQEHGLYQKPGKQQSSILSPKIDDVGKAEAPDLDFRKFAEEQGCNGVYGVWTHPFLTHTK